MSNCNNKFNDSQCDDFAGSINADADGRDDVARLVSGRALEAPVAIGVELQARASSRVDACADEDVVVDTGIDVIGHAQGTAHAVGWVSVGDFAGDALAI